MQPVARHSKNGIGPESELSVPQGAMHEQGRLSMVEIQWIDELTYAADPTQPLHQSLVGQQAWSGMPPSLQHCISCGLGSFAALQWTCVLQLDTYV